MNPPPFKGGQGRTDLEIEATGVSLLWILASLAGIITLLAIASATLN